MDSGCTRRELLGTVGTVAAGAAVTNGVSAQQLTEEWPTFGYDRTHTGHNPGGTGLMENPGGAWQYLDASGAFRRGVVVADSTVYAASEDGNCYAVDATSGESLEGWPVELGAPSQAVPTVADGTVYVGNENGTIRALDGETGETQWRFDTQGPVRGAPVAASGVVYATSMDGVVYAIDAADGTEAWTFDTGANVSGDVGIQGGPAVVAAESVTVYVANTGGLVYALDGDGAERWQGSVRAGQIQSAPVVANGSIYLTSVQSTSGFVFALDTDDGRQEWEFDVDGAVLSAPAATSEHVYVGSRDDHLYALDANSGEQQWRVDTGRDINASPAVVDGTVYVANIGNSVFAVTTEGEQRWQTETVGTIFGSPAVADGRVYLSNDNNGLYALESGGDVEFAAPARGREPVENSPLANPDSGPFAFLALPAAVAGFFGVVGGALYFLFTSEWAKQFSVDEPPIEKLYEDEDDQPNMPGFRERNETEVWSVIVDDVISRAEDKQTVAQENVIVTKHIDTALESPVTAYEVESARDEPTRVTIEEPLLSEDGREALDDQPHNEGWQIGETVTFEATVEPGETVKTMLGRPDAPEDELDALLERPTVTVDGSDGDTTASDESASKDES
jgi:outer membrane protein assembly factor BamB